MTIEEKRRIASYRQQGLGYKKIAQLTGLSANTVKSYCKRNDMGGVSSANAVQNDDRLCKSCGAVLTQVPGHKKKVFCSTDCRNRWWNSHPELINHRDGRETTCCNCGQLMCVRKNSVQKYCSHSCYISHRFRGGDQQ